MASDSYRDIAGPGPHKRGGKEQEQVACFLVHLIILSTHESGRKGGNDIYHWHNAQALIFVNRVLPNVMDLLGGVAGL
jgi:hypothetical protein